MEGESLCYWGTTCSWKEGDILGSGTCKSVGQQQVHVHDSSRRLATDLCIGVTKLDGDISL
jgi:2-keto-4-pentenoate hydratase/2-oxohepta-3-ene-1,7-dioic acid hydratase in catechol pathway